MLRIPMTMSNGDNKCIPFSWTFSAVSFFLLRPPFFISLMRDAGHTGPGYLVLAASILFYAHGLFYAYTIEDSTLWRASKWLYLHGMMVFVWYAYWRFNFSTTSYNQLPYALVMLIHSIFLAYQTKLVFSKLKLPK